MKSNMKKTATIFTVLLLVSAIGFTTVYGYGSTRRSGGSSTRVTPAIVTPSPVASQGAVLGESTFSFATNLSEGMSSDDVRELQERLRAEGFFTFPTSTGYFGPITKAAVIAYQTAKGITPAVGFVGPITRGELNK